MTRHPLSFFAVGLSVVSLSFFALTCGASSQDTPVPTRDLYLLTSKQSERTVILFEDKTLKLTQQSRERLKEYADLMARSARTLRRVLVIGTTMPTGDLAADQDLAFRRALAVRDELARLSGLSESLFLTQASRSMPGWRAAGQVFVELDVTTSTNTGAAQARVAWDTHSQRWLLICRDGAIPPARLSAPDDFSALAACDEPGRIVTNARAPVPAPNGAVAHWDAKTSRWVIRCADGTPLSGQEQDPDDFQALSRCRR
ncbi:OmpA family protein [Microvirga arsenatis]|uniref:OmpA family protein n=1 Tax=Microvirga arsenatis TaxID=2692265 RepID=A0ABW9Z012_9HYPH|nr:OmpA family protein [Microvirga arsenatis]NBJ11154.1 OmpA family protein [Microvirga arsenatis]NBJ25427.1 OmpA family protein [Microvirga arsenatis]